MACDEITERLLQIFKCDEIFRMYAKSYNKTKAIKQCSNFFNEEFQIPCFAYIYQFKVVICTLSTAANLIRGRFKDNDFDANHFSHIFIDECANTTETAALIPIVGKCFSKVISISDNTDWFIGSSLLKDEKREIPVIFKAVYGTESKLEDNSR